MRSSRALSEVALRLIPPDAQPGRDGRFHLRRSSGSVATILESETLPLEVSNVRLGQLAGVRRDLAELARMPKMSTFATGAMLNAAVKKLQEPEAFVNVGVWHGYSLLAAMVGNHEKRVIGVDNFSQFGGPRDAFMERIGAMRSRSHEF